jgi:hypothetical protein
MKSFPNWSASLATAVAGILAGCTLAVKSPGVADSIRTALDQAGLKSVSLVQDRDKGVVTLGGHIGADGDKPQSLADGEVVADRIAVLPLGAASDARAMNTDLDKGIDQNLDAVLIQSKLHKGVRYAVAASVPNVQRVVDELQVKNQKASSSE